MAQYHGSMLFQYGVIAICHFSMVPLQYVILVWCHSNVSFYYGVFMTFQYGTIAICQFSMVPWQYVILVCCHQCHIAIFWHFQYGVIAIWHLKISNKYVISTLRFMQLGRYKRDKKKKSSYCRQQGSITVSVICKIRVPPR